MADKVRDDEGKVRVFVYGTLKRGGLNAMVLRKAGAERIGFDSVTGNYMMLDMGPFPAVIEVSDTEDEQTIYGEVWAGDEEMLAALDLLEGYAGEGKVNFYHRHKVRTNTRDFFCRAWMYFLPEDWADEAEDVITHGIWQPSAREIDYWGAGHLGLDKEAANG